MYYKATTANNETSLFTDFSFDQLAQVIGVKEGDAFNSSVGGVWLSTSCTMTMEAS